MSPGYGGGGVIPRAPNRGEIPRAAPRNTSPGAPPRRPAESRVWGTAYCGVRGGEVIPLLTRRPPPPLFLDLERPERVGGGLHTRQQAVEGGDVAADSSGAERIGFHERRTRADERVIDALAGTEVPVEERFHELRDELAEVGVERVDVLRPLDLRQIVFRPREFEVDLRVESFLSPPSHDA